MRCRAREGTSRRDPHLDFRADSVLAIHPSTTRTLRALDERIDATERQSGTLATLRTRCCRSS